MTTVVSYATRDYFQTGLMNQFTDLYQATLLQNLVKHYVLTSAKGSTQFPEYPDMPYHIHILNGLYPALLLLEQHLKKEGISESEELKAYLKCLIVGFTLHDINKLVGIPDLDHAVEQKLREVCHELSVEAFFSEWRDYQNEIEFLILGTENRTSSFAFSKPIREWNFLNDTLRPACHFADSIASITDFESVSDFYGRICSIRFNNRRLDELRRLSFVEVDNNIYTLLSQKLLDLAKEVILGERGSTILFNLRNGFVYFGEELMPSGIKSIKQNFSKESGDFDPVAMTKIDHQSCRFGFIESHLLNKEILQKVIREKVNDLLKVAKDVNDRDEQKLMERRSILEALLDFYELPIKSENDKNGNAHLYLKREWDDLGVQHPLLYAFGLQKVKFLSGKISPAWREEFNRLRKEAIPFLDEKFTYPLNGQETSLKNTKELLAKFGTVNTQYTVAAVVSGCEARNKKGGFEQQLETTFSEVALAFNQKTKAKSSSYLDEFVDLYFTGNFQRPWDSLLQIYQEIPEKTEMCAFCGKRATEDYRKEKAFGIKALGFNNRTNNTLKSKTNKICTLCAQELRMRLSLYQKFSKSNSIVYYDFGDYHLNFIKKGPLTILHNLFGVGVENGNWEIQLTIDPKNLFNYNLYNLNFENISDNVKGNFYYVHRTLKLVRTYGFRVSTTSIISPSNHHNEIFVFENCMPFVKQLGWDRIRIDEVENRLAEMNLLLALGRNVLVSNVLSYAEDRKSLFSGFYHLSEADRGKVRNKLREFAESNEEEFSMSVMDKLTDVAVQIKWGYGSGSEETWMIRESLDILKDCEKEKRDRDTTIEQIAGAINRKMRGDEPQVTPSLILTFATTLYDDLFDKEWGRRIPQPGRLKNWIYQFAFLYSIKSSEEMSKSSIRKAIQALKDEGRQIDEESVLSEVVKVKKERKKYEDEYRELYRKHFAQSA